MFRCRGRRQRFRGFPATDPNVIGNPNSGPRSVAEWFNTSAFQQLQPDPLGRFEVFGDEGRNAVEGPRIFELGRIGVQEHSA